VGVLGAGQLGRMLALSGHELGLEFVFLDPTDDSPASKLGPQLLADYTDAAALGRLAECDLVTYEFESVPVAAAEALEAKLPVYPPAEALRVAQDRLNEKQCFRSLGIPTPNFAGVQSERELLSACEELGFPSVLKTRRLGYDGKGQRVLRTEAEARAAFAELGQAPLILEQFVDFERELSLLGVRGRDGSAAFYPLVENQHRDGILRVTRAPAPRLAPALQQRAESYVRALFDRLGYVGVLALELFESGGELVANEIAPRVHNSGHFTIEGAATSQFENHLRAVLGWPLGSTEVPVPCAMLNCVGTMPDAATVLRVPGAHLHSYGKSPRPGRKLGHVTLTGELELESRIAELCRLPGVG
jgi:5-(carboxyamino)imidazole ribonucleotide synthase